MVNKFFIVLNPEAGTGKASEMAPKIEAFFKARGADFRLIRTLGPGDAIKIVTNADIDEDTPVIAAGGDGTCNEVVNGLMARGTSKPPLFGILPIGRGNDFAYSARVSTDIDRALAGICAGRTTELDVGWVKGGFFPEGRFFVNGVGIGFDTKVGFEAAKMPHVHSGIAYVFGAVKMVAKFDLSPLVSITRDDTTVTLRTAIISVMNGSRMGGSFFMCPRAKINDGTLDICTVAHPDNRRRLIRLVLSYTTGTQERFPEVAMTRATRFHLRALDGGLAAHADGETVCYDGRELDLGCVPKALRLIGDW